MTGQAINENSIDDFTQEELVEIAYALGRYSVFLQNQADDADPFSESYLKKRDKIYEIRKKVAGFINS